MGTPHTRADRHAATYDWAGVHVHALVHEAFPDHRTTILDVGAGWGKYRDLLHCYATMDAVEVWTPYVEQEALADRYKLVFQADVYDLAIEGGVLGHYDLVIFGDVLEHLRTAQARLVLAECRAAIVVVPFEYAQGEEDGNPYEAHLQPDLTPDVMTRRYPDLRLTSYGCQSWNDGHRPADALEVDRPFKGIYVKGLDV